MTRDHSNGDARPFSKAALLAQSARRSAPAYTLNAFPRAKPHNSRPNRAAVDIANELGADTPTTPHNPAANAF